MRLLEIDALCKNNENLLCKLREWKLIPSEPNYLCKKCGGVLKLGTRDRSIDGWQWRCSRYVRERKQKRKRCGYQVAFRSGTFFAQSKLSIFQILGFVRMWLFNLPLMYIGDELLISGQHTLVDWASFCREVVLCSFMDNMEQLGGEGKIVEIDESKFGKRKYNRGKFVDGQWVFGGYERGTGRVFLVPVKERSSEVLVPIIKQWIAPGTTIVSDCWRAYDCLENEGFKHLKVNHSITFKDPDSGAHTNSIESTWRAAKVISSGAGRKKSSIAGNLAKYMFQKRCRDRNVDCMDEFLIMAGCLYDVTVERPPNTLPSLEDGAIDSEDDYEC